MNKFKLLDCTLRDGGRIIDCKFQDNEITDIAQRLQDANIEIIEMGFLRDPVKVDYKGDSTFFTKVEQIAPFIPKERNNTLYVAFIDYSMFDFDSLTPYDGKSVEGLRIGFTKKDFDTDLDNLILALKKVKKLGYKLFIQGVNSLAYTDLEFLKIIEFVNEIEPYAFAIVDTYGAMYEEDFSHLFDLADKNLKDGIVLAFHSHNNYQLSFSLAQKFIQLSIPTTRDIVIDGTLNGMGKCAGNLNLELIADYLNRKYGYNYKTENLMDIIDEYMYNIQKNCTWGYSIPSVLAAIYKSHPNNVIYLTEKFRLSTKDIKYILSMIPEDKRTRYDYDLIKQLYIDYNHTKVDDAETLKLIKEKLDKKNILILVPGNSLITHKNEILLHMNDDNLIVIPVNHISDLCSKKKQLPFFGSEKRYSKFALQKDSIQNIVVSNIFNHKPDDYVVNYESLIERNNKYFDSSIIMLLNLLHSIDIDNYTIAGFDGFKSNENNYYNKEMFEDGRFQAEYDDLTSNIKLMLKDYVKKINKPENIKFITPSMYENIFHKD